MTSARFERVVGESGKLMDIEGFERDNWVLDIIFKVFFLFFFFCSSNDDGEIWRVEFLFANSMLSRISR